MIVQSTMAMYCTGGKAYSGEAVYSNAELKSRKDSVVSTYTVGNGTVTFKTNGRSNTYRFDSTHIYMGSMTLHKVAPH